MFVYCNTDILRHRRMDRCDISSTIVLRIWMKIVPVLAPRPRNSRPKSRYRWTFRLSSHFNCLQTLYSHSSQWTSCCLKGEVQVLHTRTHSWHSIATDSVAMRPFPAASRHMGQESGDAGDALHVTDLGPVSCSWPHSVSYLLIFHCSLSPYTALFPYRLLHSFTLSSPQYNGGQQIHSTEPPGSGQRLLNYEQCGLNQPL